MAQNSIVQIYTKKSGDIVYIYYFGLIIDWLNTQKHKVSLRTETQRLYLYVKFGLNKLDEQAETQGITKKEC